MPRISRPASWTDRYVYVNDLKRFLEVKTGALYDKEQLVDMHGYISVMDTSNPTGPGKSIAADDLFLHSGQRSGRSVRCITYRPGKEPISREGGRLALNIWEPPSVVPTEDDLDTLTRTVEPWLDLLRHVLPDPAVLQHHLRYFAHILQSTSIGSRLKFAKINHALLLAGQKGIGKDSCFEPLVRILGPRSVGIITPSDLCSDFTDWAYQRLLIVVEELAAFTNRDLANRLKPMLSCPPYVVRVNKKHVPQFDIPNQLMMIAMSNKEKPLAIEDGDRRFHYYWSPATPKPPDYYGKFYKWLDQHLADVYGFLLQVDISKFNPFAAPPVTADKLELIEASKPLIEQFVEHIVDQAPDLVTVDEIRGKLPNGLKADTSPHRLSSELEKLGAKKIARVRLPTSRPHIWALRRPDLYGGLSESALALKFEEMHKVSVMPTFAEKL